MTHIPYRGTGQSVPALLGGHVQVLFSAYPSLVGAVESKKVKLLAHNGAGRWFQAPDVPPIADVIPGFDLATIVGLFAQARHAAGGRSTRSPRKRSPPSTRRRRSSSSPRPASSRPAATAPRSTRR